MSPPSDDSDPVLFPPQSLRTTSSVQETLTITAILEAAPHNHATASLTLPKAQPKRPNPPPYQRFPRDAPTAGCAGTTKFPATNKGGENLGRERVVLLLLGAFHLQHRAGAGRQEEDLGFCF